MLGIELGSTFTNVFLGVVSVGSMALVLYWAATIENNIENNPDNN